MSDAPELDVSRMLEGAHLLLLGGTGFLGKLFCSMLLDRCAEVGRVFLVVRGKGSTPEARFWKDIAPSDVLEPLRRAHGPQYESFLREKVVPIDGDMGRALCGLDAGLVRELCGTIDAVVNVAGVVDFKPPLDAAIHVNAMGAQNLVALARALGDVPVFHTSTCFVAGQREGPILEEDPRIHPFPRAHELGAAIWSPDREIAECLELVAQANRRCDDAFRQSDFAQSARKNLEERGEPAHGHAYERELTRVKRRFVFDRLVQAGLDRAAHWGWPNIYTYTKAIGEQVIAGSGLPFAIARPAICESTVEFPFPAFNEGANATAPFVYFVMKGQPLILVQDVTIDLIPSDYVVAGMIVALAELLEGTARPVYHLGTSDVNPCSATLFGEVVGLYKRKHFQRKAGGNPLLNALHARFEPTYVGRTVFDRFGPSAVASAARGVASLFRRTLAPMRPAAAALEGFARSQEKIDQVLTIFEPFATQANGPFDCSNVRAAHARLSDADKAKLPWAPEAIDWADWTMNAQMPAFEKRIIPEIDRRASRPPRVIAAHETLVTLVDEMAQRHDMALALQRVTGDGLTRTTFGDVRVRSLSVAARLAALGVRRGDRVAISAQNHPDWAIAFFGVVRAGATAVPVDAALDAGSWRNLLAESGALAVVWNETVAAAGEVAAAHPGLARLDLHEATQHDPALFAPDFAPDRRPEPADVAVLFEKGTGGRSPERVALTHASLTSLVAALSPIFPLSPGEAVLSFLPLHQPLELTRGLLLPFSRGARVVYAGQLTENGVAEAAQKTRARLVPAGAELPREARECFARLGVALPDATR